MPGSPECCPKPGSEGETGLSRAGKPLPSRWAQRGHAPPGVLISPEPCQGVTGLPRPGSAPRHGGVRPPGGPRCEGVPGDTGPGAGEDGAGGRHPGRGGRAHGGRPAALDTSDARNDHEHGGVTGAAE